MKHASILKGLHALLMLLVVSVSSAQNDIGITLNIVPPYTTRFAEYAETPGKVILVIRNNTNSAKNIYMRGMVTGDNGITMYNDVTVRPSSPVTLQPFQVFTANSSTIQDLFSVEKYKMTGITPAQIASKNGLPEGNYNICIRAYDYNTGAPLSGDAPQGCKMIPLASLEPPYPLKPLADEEIKIPEPHNVIFSWTLPAGAEPGTQYKLRIIEMLDPKKNINDAYHNSATPAFFEVTVSANVFVYGPAQPKLLAGRKYAWAVTAMPGPKKVAYKNNGTSEVRAFTFVKPEPPKAKGPVITLLEPANKADFPSIGESGNIINLKWDYTNPDKQVFYEDALIYEVTPGQTPEDAVKKNERVNSTKEPYKSAGFGSSTADGKTYAWYVKLNDNGTTYSSEIRTFSIQQNKAAGTKITHFDFGGYPITVSSLKDKGGYLYSGSGTTKLFKGGPDVSLVFENITIKPFNLKMVNMGGVGKPKDMVVEYTEWTATSGSVKCKKFFKKKLTYTLPEDIDGELWFQADQLELHAALKVASKGDGTFYTTETYGDHGGILSGTFNWQTNFLYTAENGEEKTALYTDHVDARFDYNKKFRDTDPIYLLLQSPDGYNTMKLTAPKNTTLKLVPLLYITENGKTPKFSFDGYFEIPKLKNEKPGITVGFSQQSSLVFDTKTPEHTYYLTNDNSVRAHFDNVHLDLVGMPALTIPDFYLKFQVGPNYYSLPFTQGYFTYSGGLYCKEIKLNTGKMVLGGFDVTYQKEDILINKSKLYYMNVEGKLDIPFVNQTADVLFSASEEGINTAGVSFPQEKPVVLYQNMAGDKCELTPSFGSFSSDKLLMSGSVTFSNVNDGEKNLNITDLVVPDFYIKPDGTVGMMDDNYYGSPVPYQTAGTYNGFKFSPASLKFSKEGGQYRVDMKGTVVLADNLASDSKGPNFSTYALFDATKPKGGGPPPNQDVSINSGSVQGGRHDNAVNFGVDFKYYDDDPVYGKGFMCDGYYGIQQPNPMKVHAKMIIARAPGDFNYWFFEAGQENVITIPTGVLDLGIYGFAGRVYYKMGHSGTNIYKDDYVPDGNKFIGIYGLTQLKTLTDNGIKFWGKVGFEVVTNWSGLESISFRGDGEIFSEGVGTNGMIRAHDCRLDFYWSPKHVYADFPVTFNFKNMVSGNADAGFSITPDAIDIWGSASSASLFNLVSCGAVSCGFELTDVNARIWGTFNLVKIHRGFDFFVCKPDVDVYAKLGVNASVNYSPFQFKGEGNFHGHIHVDGCKLSGNININLNAQVMFPNPTCVSAGIDVETPLKDFGFHAGISNGSIFFGKCYN